MTGSRRAAFLDRDGTLIEDANYLAQADHVRLLPGAPDAVRALNDHGVLAIVITNQSGIAQGLLTEAQYASTRDRLDHLMKSSGARIDATYHCPHYPPLSGPCECRKPGTLLYRRAAEHFGIDLATSLYVGDRDRDIAPGLAFGGFVRLVPSGSTPDGDHELARGHGVLAASLGEAIDDYLKRVP
ncbi:MAG TPA: HAD-IIIA family hydrolase [Gemmatimonadaceae bacterium]